MVRIALSLRSVCLPVCLNLASVPRGAARLPGTAPGEPCDRARVSFLLRRVAPRNRIARQRCPETLDSSRTASSALLPLSPSARTRQPHTSIQCPPSRPRLRNRIARPREFRFLPPAFALQRRGCDRTARGGESGGVGPRLPQPLFAAFPASKGRPNHHRTRAIDRGNFRSIRTSGAFPGAMNPPHVRSRGRSPSGDERF
jgi:hypothetical protein